MNQDGLITVELTKVKEAKNTVRYEATPGVPMSECGANVSLLYVKKTGLATAFSGFPEKIKITVEMK